MDVDMAEDSRIWQKSLELTMASTVGTTGRWAVSLDTVNGKFLNLEKNPARLLKIVEFDFDN